MLNCDVVVMDCNVIEGVVVTNFVDSTELLLNVTGTHHEQLPATPIICITKVSAFAEHTIAKLSEVQYVEVTVTT